MDSRRWLISVEQRMARWLGNRVVYSRWHQRIWLIDEHPAVWLANRRLELREVTDGMAGEGSTALEISAFNGVIEVEQGSLTDEMVDVLG